MLGHSVFNYDTLKKYIIYFGTVFNDISIKRDDASGTTAHLLRVPIMYGPREKMIARVLGDPSLYPGRPQAITLPRMSFEITGMNYDSSRQLPGTHIVSVADADDNNALKTVYVPVPYNIEIRMTIAVKNAEDGAKIVGQILPFFKPDWTANLELIEGIYSKDIPIEIVGNAQVDDHYEASFLDRRVITWTIPFRIRGYFFGPVVKKKIIKFTTINVIGGEQSENNSPMSTVTVSPGMDANGNPTTNADASVHWSEINIDDEYDFVEVYSGIQVFE